MIQSFKSSFKYLINNSSQILKNQNQSINLPNVKLIFKKDLKFIHNQRDSSEKNSNRWSQVNLVFVVSVSICSITNMYLICKKYSSVFASEPRSPRSQLKAEYIYIIDPISRDGFWKSTFSRLIRIPRLGYLFLLSKRKNYIAWRCLNDSMSDEPSIRRRAINILAEMESLDDLECKQIAQLMPMNVAVSLAHRNADLRLIPDFTPKLSNKRKLLSLYRDILSVLPNNLSNENLFNFTKDALKLFKPIHEEIFEDFSFDFNSGFACELNIKNQIAKRMKEDTIIKSSLLAIQSHSVSKSSIKTLTDSGTFGVLKETLVKYKDCDDIKSIIIKILANFSVEPYSLEPIFRTGLLKFVAELSQSSDLKFSLPAQRILHNLDREFDTPILPSGIYQFYPKTQSNENDLKVDVVFVHGLLGAAYKTWRRQDLNNIQGQKDVKTKRTILAMQALSWPEFNLKDPDKHLKPYGREWSENKWKYYEGLMPQELDKKIPSSHTQCWPRDWLPLDCPNARILAVDFDTFITKWSQVCPVESLSRTLFDRSFELLQKLSEAGLGSRPIIWVTHSMGGLLVKQILSLSKDNLAKMTKGIVFYCVPHSGSHMATLNRAGKLLLMPTIEVIEMNKDSYHLKKLHETFKELQEKYNFNVVSFGETKDMEGVFGLKFKLVPFSSADPGIGDFYLLDLDHLNMCKPYSRGSFVYVKVAEMIKEALRQSEQDYLKLF